MDKRQDPFYVVEQFVDGQSKGYWTGGSSRDFTTRIDDAMQFCRREDATKAIWGWHWQDVRITEHLYFRAESKDADQAAEIARETWQPISTAPKDGTDIIVCDSADLVGHAFFNRAEKRWDWLDGDPVYGAKCWQSFPDPPVAPSEAGKEVKDADPAAAPVARRRQGEE